MHCSRVILVVSLWAIKGNVVNHNHRTVYLGLLISKFMSGLT